MQEVPSSHGSSLAAVLSQLGLSGPGGSLASHAGAAGSVAAGTSQRRLRHGGEEDEFGSFKTALGSCAEASSHGSATLESHPIDAASSWHSARTGSCASSERLAELGGRQGSHGLSSTASSTLPGHAPQAGAAEGAAGAAQAAGADAGTTPRRLSSVAANQRASSLQEEHLHGFLASGKEQASRAADAAARQGTAP